MCFSCYVSMHLNMMSDDIAEYSNNNRTLHDCQHTHTTSNKQVSINSGQVRLVKAEEENSGESDERKNTHRAQ